MTTTESSRALQWDEIQSFECAPAGSYWLLKLNSGEKLQLNLSGYTPEKREALRSLIEVNADLYPHPKNKSLFVRSSIALPAGYRRR